MTNELNKIFPSSVQVTIKEETFTISPYKFGQINKVIKAAQPMFGYFRLVDTSGSAEEVGAQLITTVLANCGDSVAEIISISVNKDREWVDELEADEVIELIAAIIEVNKDFFIQRVLPLLKQKAETLQKK